MTLDNKQLALFQFLPVLWSLFLLPLSPWINSSSYRWVPGAIFWHLPHKGVLTAQDPWGPTEDHADGSSIGIGRLRPRFITGTFRGIRWRRRDGSPGKRNRARCWAEQPRGAQKRWRFTGLHQMRFLDRWKALRPDLSHRYLYHLLCSLCYEQFRRT